MRTAVRLFFPSSSDCSDDVNTAGDGVLNFSDEQIRKHLRRRWLKSGSDPTRMSAERKALEMAFNPLIALLSSSESPSLTRTRLTSFPADIKITIVEGAEDDTVGSDDSDTSQRRGGVDRSRMKIDTDSEGEEEDDYEPTDDTDWGSDGMGKYNGLVKTPPRRNAPLPSSPRQRKRTKVVHSEEEDVKPTTTPKGSLSKPAGVVVAVEEDVKPIIIVRDFGRLTRSLLTRFAQIDDDEEEEPSTEEDEPNDLDKDVKPFASLARPAAVLPPPQATAVKQEPLPVRPVLFLPAYLLTHARL